MFEELTRHINKPIALLLKNGKEKKGIIVFMDSDDQTACFEDGSVLAISFIKNIMGAQIAPQPLVESRSEIPAQEPLAPVETKVAPQEQDTPAPVAVVETTLVPQETPQKDADKTEATDEASLDTATLSEVLPESEPVVIPQTSPEVLEKVKQIQEKYNARLSEVRLTLQAPELSGMPNEIKEIDGIGKSEEAKMWTNILNQYNDGVRLGKFATDTEKVEKTIVHVKNLSQSPFLYAFVAIPQLLGYLHFMRGNKREAIEHIKHAVRVQDSPENAISLATIALELGENELAFFTLKKLFLKVNFTEDTYKNVWSKFLELVIKMGAYTDFSMIFSGKYRQFSPEEKNGVLEAAVYFLLHNRQRKDAEDLIDASMKNTSDVRYLALDALKKWGLPDREYEKEPTNDDAPAIQQVPKKEIISLPPSHRNKARLHELTKNPPQQVSQYTFSSTVMTLRENYGFIKYGTNNLFFHAFDLANCLFTDLSEGDQVEFKLKKGVKGTDVACEVKMVNPPKREFSEETSLTEEENPILSAPSKDNSAEE